MKLITGSQQPGGVGDGNSELIDLMESRGFEVELSETGRKDVDQLICYVYWANCSKGFFGMNEVAALKEAVEAGELGR